MGKVIDCLSCSQFINVAYVHPDSVTAKRDGVQYGWYIKCGVHPENRVKVDGALWKTGKEFICLDYRDVKKFLKLNGAQIIECPINKVQGLQKQQPALFGEEV